MAEEKKQSKAKKSKKKQVDPQQQRAKMTAMELVRLRNNFYRDNYRRLVSMGVLFGLLLVALAVTAGWLLTHRPAPRYFATNIEGGLIEIQPLNQPVLSSEELLGWATRGAVSAFTLNYVQYKQQIEMTTETYFTNSGGDQYQQALQESNDISYITTGKFLVTAAPSAAPRILAQGVVPQGQYKGRYAWQVQIPLTVTAQNERTIRPSQLLVDLVIVRSSTMVDKTAASIDAARGIGIAELIAAKPKKQTKGTS